jgi:hypothetical protein
MKTRIKSETEGLNQVCLYELFCLKYSFMKNKKTEKERKIKKEK